ncbi:MAG: polyamine aminopropyltransferase [Calditrichaeota bacterium]|nr:polyamine aminopropyltransferase [Calditrichota bacterium]
MLSSQFPFILKHLRNKESWVLYLSMFIMGACGLAYEYTLSKVSSDILGNSTRQWALIIGIMMFFMGIGADLQKHFSDKYIFDYFIFWEIIIGLTGAFGPIVFIYVYGKYPMEFVLIQYFFIIVIGLIIGFEIPLISRINESYIHQLKLNLAAVLKMDYIGSLSGALAWIFVLPRFFEQVQSAFVLGLLNLAVAGFTLYFFRENIKHTKLLFILIIISIAATAFGFSQSKNWRIYSEQFLYRDRIIFTSTTRYQHIVLTKSRSNDISCYINGHLQFSGVDEFIYHENLVHPAFAIAPYHRNVLILGGGDGLALREVLKYKDVRNVTLCDIDPQMTTLAAENSYFKQLNDNSLLNSCVVILENNALIPADTITVYSENRNLMFNRKMFPTAKVEIINLDAVAFVEQISGIYDIIILDFPDPNSPDLAKLYSVQFYENLKKKLSADGILVQQSTSPYHAKEVFLSIGRTLKASGFSVIPYKDNVPTFGEWGWWIGGHQDRYSDVTLYKKLSSVKRLEVTTKYLSAEVIKSTLVFGANQLDSQEKDINSLANNNAYFYYLNSWQQ